METTEWVSPVVLALKKNGKLRVCINYKALNKVTKKDRYPLPFCEEILEEVAGHEMYTFGDGYRGYHQVKIALKDQLKTTFTTPWGTFCYTIMPFGLCNVPRTFQCLMNNLNHSWAFFYKFSLMTLEFIVIKLLTLLNLN